MNDNLTINIVVKGCTEERIRKETMGQIARINTKLGVLGSVGRSGRGVLFPVSNSARARKLMNIAPTPIGPKWPQNQASLQDLTSGIRGLRANIIGIRRNRRMSIAIQTSLHGTMVRRGEFMLLQGMILP